MANFVIMINFDEWFKAQFGGLPNMHKQIKLQEKRIQLEAQLEQINSEIKHLDMLQEKYTVARYAVNAATSFTNGGKIKRG